jgi:RluA family pseudouridine synthase
VRLRPDDRVELLARAGELRPAPAARARGALPAVLFESRGSLVVDKPAGIPTVPDRSGREPGVHGLLAQLRPGEDLRIVHRLDRDTSGCLVLGKGLAAARHFDALFRRGEVHKEYLALVHGDVQPDARTVEHFLGPDRRRPGLVAASRTARKGFRQARTDLQVVERHGAFTLVRCLPRTGRGHQIRVHLQSIGHPIAGDLDYGGETLFLSRLKRGYKLRPGVAERPLLGRTFLHAAAVRFLDPDGSPVAVEAPLPDDLRQCLDRVARLSARPGRP